MASSPPTLKSNAKVFQVDDYHFIAKSLLSFFDMRGLRLGSGLLEDKKISQVSREYDHHKTGEVVCDTALLMVTFIRYRPIKADIPRINIYAAMWIANDWLSRNGYKSQYSENKESLRKMIERILIIMSNLPRRDLVFLKKTYCELLYDLLDNIYSEGESLATGKEIR